MLFLLILFVNFEQILLLWALCFLILCMIKNSGLVLSKLGEALRITHLNKKKNYKIFLNTSMKKIEGLLNFFGSKKWFLIQNNLLCFVFLCVLSKITQNLLKSLQMDRPIFFRNGTLQQNKRLMMVFALISPDCLLQLLCLQCLLLLLLINSLLLLFNPLYRLRRLRFLMNN